MAGYVQYSPLNPQVLATLNKGSLGNFFDMWSNKQNQVEQNARAQKAIADERAYQDKVRQEQASNLLDRQREDQMFRSALQDASNLSANERITLTDKLARDRADQAAIAEAEAAKQAMDLRGMLNQDINYNRDLTSGEIGSKIASGVDIGNPNYTAINKPFDALIASADAKNKAALLDQNNAIAPKEERPWYRFGPKSTTQDPTTSGRTNLYGATDTKMDTAKPKDYYTSEAFSKELDALNKQAIKTYEDQATKLLGKEKVAVTRGRTFNEKLDFLGKEASKLDPSKPADRSKLLGIKNLGETLLTTKAAEDKAAEDLKLFSAKEEIKAGWKDTSEVLKDARKNNKPLTAEEISKVRKNALAEYNVAKTDGIDLWGLAADSFETWMSKHPTYSKIPELIK